MSDVSRAAVVGALCASLALPAFGQSPSASHATTAPATQETTTQRSAATGTGFAGAAPDTGQAATQPDPNNCGTPSEPKACPPMPRRPLNQYPANKQ